IAAVAPAGTGTVDVTVTAPLGTSATSAADQFSYIPTLMLASTASATTQVGQSYAQTNAASGGTTPDTYTVSAGELPAGTTLSTSTGTVSGTPTTAGAFSYAITATDSGSPAQTATQTVSGIIAPATLTLTATASSTTQLGQFYRQTNVAGGGTAPYTYSLLVGTLPPGTTLNTSNGTVYGTLTTAGVFTYTIEATDSGNPAQTATQASSGTMTPATLTLVATASSATQVGQFYRPTNARAFSYAITATDSGSPAQTATQTVSGIIAPATLTLTATASSTTQLGQFYRQTNVAGGGTAPYTYSLLVGTLPPGTTLNTSNGTVYGTLTTAGVFTYTI